MHVPQEVYDLEGFCQALLDIDESHLFEGQHLHQIKTYFYLTEHDDWKASFGQSYQEEDYGEITKLTREFTTRSGEAGRAVFYAAYYEDDLLIIFTSATEDAIDQTLENSVNASKELAEMPIVPRDFQKMNEMVLSKYEEVDITEFKSKRIPDLADAEIRPEYDRTMEYKGRDGRQTLKEFRQYYGVVPVRIQYEHEDIALRIDTNGKFTLIRLNNATFTLLFELIEEVLDHVLDIQEVSQEIRFRTEKRRSGDLELEVPTVTAGQIEFQKSFNRLMAEEFVQNAGNRSDTPFTFTDVSMEAGSLDFTATVTDEQRSAFFNISATEDAMRIVPKHNCAFPSLIRFYQLLTETIDESAQITLFDDESAYSTSAS
ncbi:hypothetical protein [Halomarina ordinaria]|uniref:Uncharacterized protein n=1 Tax=Halomarina ordinaria TaxID=3033939 RepID=A0ABD5UHP9_9EURY|nr:hypothetical protein [Halomarina sp. PSRA2]